MAYLALGFRESRLQKNHKKSATLMFQIVGVSVLRDSFEGSSSRHWAGRTPSNASAIRHVSNDSCTSGNKCISSNPDPLYGGTTYPEPHAVTNMDIAGYGDTRTDVHPLANFAIMIDTGARINDGCFTKSYTCA
jgi:hypothetical protein